MNPKGEASPPGERPPAVPPTPSSCITVEEEFPVADTEQEPEPGQVRVQFIDVVAVAPDEPSQRIGHSAVITYQPLAEKLQHFAELDCVSWIQTHLRHCHGTPPESSLQVRSEERRVGKECRSRWSP